MRAEGKNPLTGIICLWSGAIVDIPDGWLLCDGNNGTPDLTDRFILGAGDLFAVDDTGGSSAHGHSLTMDEHYHWLTGGTNLLDSQPNGYVKATTSRKTTTGVADAEPHIPPYYALAFIMKE